MGYYRKLKAKELRKMTKVNFVLNGKNLWIKRGYLHSYHIGKITTTHSNGNTVYNAHWEWENGERDVYGFADPLFAAVYLAGLEVKNGDISREEFEVLNDDSNPIVSVAEFGEGSIPLNALRNTD